MATPTTKELEEKRSRLRHWISPGRAEAATEGVNHLAVFAKDLEITAEFYSQVMGMPVVQVTSNRDVARIDPHERCHGWRYDLCVL